MVGRRIVCRVALRARLCYAQHTGDTRALILTIIGTGFTVVTIVVAVLSMQIAGVNTRIDDMNRRIDDVNLRIGDVNGRIDELRTEVRDLRADLVRFDERLDAVQVAVGKVEQRLDTLERVLLPSREPAGGVEDVRLEPFSDCPAGCQRSTARATPLPPPRQRVATPRLAFRLRMA